MRMGRKRILGPAGIVALTLAGLSMASAQAARTAAAKGATLSYQRVFKGSSPELIQVKVYEDSDGATCEIRQLDEDPGASPFTVSAPLRAKMFALAAELNHFAGADLDVKRKLANFGEKKFRWERGTEAHETTFNYTLNAAANQLMQIFEGLARQQEDFMTLGRRMKYDRLGVNDALLDIEFDLSRNLLPEPQHLLPLLDQIVNDSHFVEVARERARALATQIRRAKQN